MKHSERGRAAFHGPRKVMLRRSSEAIGDVVSMELDQENAGLIGRGGDRRPRRPSAAEWYLIAQCRRTAAR